ncbi:MAG: glycosyl transferase family 2, partial [Halobacteriaceae archaeon]
MASGDTLAFIGTGSQIESEWLTAVTSAMDAGAMVVSGPVHRNVSGGVTTETPEETMISGSHVTYFDGGNV